jgi:crotonobetainyl-CoA:carnitine CoA-transferase CaiB-like acyl-CoA transferase
MVRGAPLTWRTTQEWLEILQAQDIATKPCHTLETLPRDPHLEAVGLLRRDTHPTEGVTIGIRPTIRFGDDYLPMRSFAQPRGWETRQVLEELGYGPDEIEALRAEAAVIGPEGSAKAR